MLFRKLLLAGAVAAAGLLAGTSAAPAAINITPATTPVPLTTDPAGADTLTFDLDGYVSCESTLGLTVIPPYYPVGQGAALMVETSSFFSCNTGAVTGNVSWPWYVRAVPTSSTVNAVTIDYVSIVATLFGSPCTFQGSLSGTYDETTDRLTFSAATGLTKTAGSFICPAAPTVTAQFAVSPTTLDIS